VSALSASLFSFKVFSIFLRLRPPSSVSSIIIATKQSMNRAKTTARTVDLTFHPPGHHFQHDPVYKICSGKVQQKILPCIDPAILLLMARKFQFS
jgi:hypothetical protein